MALVAQSRLGLRRLFFEKAKITHRNGPQVLLQPLRTLAVMHRPLRKSHDGDGEKKKNMEEEDEEEDVRERILSAGLARVPELGWSSAALQRGAEDAGFPSVTAGIVGNDAPIALVRFHTRTADDRLEDMMRAQAAALRERNERLRVRRFIREQVETRLRMNMPYMAHWAEALALMSSPLELVASIEVGLTRMDTIWHHAGDTATDVNWYTKRLSLAAIYKATELAMLQDDGANEYRATWAFLDRRFEDEIELAKMIGSSKDVQRVLCGVVTTLQNMAGLQKK